MSEPNPNIHPLFTEPTTYYWQSILQANKYSSSLPLQRTTRPPYQYNYPAALHDSRILLLPIRPLATNPGHAVASLLVNHASLSVVEELGRHLAGNIEEQLLVRDPACGVLGSESNDIVLVGVPTLGLGVAEMVAGKLGFERYIPLGYSRKFWYDDALSAKVSSVTSPGTGLKKVYLDPNLLPLMKGKRILIVDDVVSSGRTLNAVWDLLEGDSIGCKVLAAAVFMKQGMEWKELLGEERTAKVVAVLESPLLKAVEGGWDLR